MKKYDIKQIANYYFNDKYTFAQISNIINIPTSTIRYQLKKHGYLKKSSKNLGKNRRCSVDLDYFKKIDSKSKAYVLGLIISDGYVDEKWNKLNFTSKDIELVEIIKRELKSDHKLGKYDIYDNRTHKNYERYSIQISSKEIVSDLNKLGVYGNKSFTSELPDIPEEFMWDFIRGVFDGDGHIIQSNNDKIGRLRFGIIGSEKLLKSINLFFKENKIKNVKIRQTIYGNSKGKLIKLDCCNFSDLNIIKNNIYENSEELRLTRKYEIFQTLKEYKLGSYDRTPNLRKIEMYDYKKKILLKTFKNIHEACDEINSNYKSIHRVAMGERHHTKGYSFKYC